MSNRVYLVALDAADTAADPIAFKDFLGESEDIASWWHHLPFVYLVETDLAAEVLSDRVRAVAGDTSFLVVEARLEQSQGWLPERAWRWIKRRSEHSKQESSVLPTS